MFTEKKFVLVDGSSYLYRAFHALPPLTTAKGQATGAVYGVINMLRRLLLDQAPDYMAVVFDAKGKTFRHDLYDQYKANRPPMPDDLRSQIEPLHEIIEAMGIPLLVVEGVEADDVIGTLARQGEAHGMRTLISTGDKDMAQLVDDHVTLINTMTNTVTDTAGVREKYGVTPEQIVDYLTLVGDTSDNIPGVPKVGPKTASKWLQDYGSLDEVVAHAADIKGKIGEHLRAALDQLPLSRVLATIKCNVPLAVTPEQLSLSPPEQSRLGALFTQLEFNTWLAELSAQPAPPTMAPTQATASTVTYETILSQVDFERWLQRLARAELIAFDTETTSLDYMEAQIVGVSFAVTPGHAAYVPLAHDYAGAPQQLARHEVLNALKPLLEDPQRLLLGQNLKYDMNVLANYDIHPAGIHHDTMLQSYVLNSTGSRHDMDTLALKHLNRHTVHYEDIAGKGAKQITFNEIDIDTAAHYAAEDADVTLCLHQALWPKLQQEPLLQHVYEAIEIPLIPVLSRVERNGVLVDARKLEEQSREISAKLIVLEDQAYQLAGGMFNLGSPKQIQEILFEKLGLPVLQKTPKGQPSTAEGVLQELALDYPLPRVIMDHRGLSKLRSTYTDRLPEQINPGTGRVHTSYHQAIASTGRLSSSDPNLQNIPIRTEEGRRIRQAFVAAPGYRILAADYSQIELRILAHLSEDAGLLQAFAQGADIHRATAADVFNTTPDRVSTEQRRSAKAINFGLVYGMSAFGLAKQLGVDRGTAQEYINMYFARYPGVKLFMDRTRDLARAQGYVSTVCGRRLYLPEINSRNAQRRQYAERTAINAPMQGTAADIIKLAMIATDQWLTQENINARMIMQVHDELVFEVATSAVDTLREQVSALMSGVLQLNVPLVVDAGVGENWDQAH